MRRLTLCYHVLALTTFSACSSDEFTTADSGSPGIEAGVDVVASDVTTMDVVGDVSSPTFCESQPSGSFIVCEDFDRPLQVAWNQDINNTQPLPKIVSKPTKGGVGSLKMASTAVDGGAFTFARYVRFVTPPTVTTSTLEADMNIESAIIPQLNTLVPLAFGLREPTGNQVALPVALQLGDTGWGCVGPDGIPKNGPGLLASDVWHHVKLTAVSVGNSKFDVTCDVDGTTVALNGVIATGHTGDRRLALGHNTTPFVGKVVIYLDNYVFRAQ